MGTIQPAFNLILGVFTSASPENPLAGLSFCNVPSSHFGVLKFVCSTNNNPINFHFIVCGLRRQIFEKLRRLSKGDIGNIDVWVGGLLETSESGPGELFTTVIEDQFRRIRDGDRFWFENKENG